jgi:hypothetical protein
MKMPIARTLAASVAFAALFAAASANAAERPHRAADAYASEHYYAAPRAYDVEENPNADYGPRVTVQPGDAVSGNMIVGRDPDPFIAGQILRDYDSGWPD